MKIPFFKNTAGEPSASLTMALIAFLVVTLWLLIWLIATPLGAAIPEFDAGTAMTYLMPILTLYFGRRYTAKIKNGDKAAEINLEAPTPPET